jgi:glutaredoxin-like YruB-family protein
MKITVYSTSGCQWCRRLKEWLREHKIEFEDIDVGTDIKAARKMIEESSQTGVPVTKIDNEIVVGFDINKLKKLLNIKE